MPITYLKVIIYPLNKWTKNSVWNSLHAAVARRVSIWWNLQAYLWRARALIQRQRKTTIASVHLVKPSTVASIGPNPLLIPKRSFDKSEKRWSTCCKRRYNRRCSGSREKIAKDTWRMTSLSVCFTMAKMICRTFQIMPVATRNLAVTLMTVLWIFYHKFLRQCRELIEARLLITAIRIIQWFRRQHSNIEIAFKSSKFTVTKSNTISTWI